MYIVGIIYPIPIYKFKWHIFPNRWQCISNENNSKKCTFPNPAPKGHTDTHQITYIPVREASPNQYRSFFNIVERGGGRSNPYSKNLLQILYNSVGLLAT